MPEEFPVAERLELSEAQLQAFHGHEATLFDLVGDRVVEVEGIRAPLSALFKLCPVDKENMTQEAIDNYAVGLLERSGVELPDEVRESVTERHEQRQAEGAAEDAKKKDRKS